MAKVTSRKSVTSGTSVNESETNGIEKPIIANAFLKNVSKMQLYKFYPNSDKNWLDSEHNRVNNINTAIADNE